MKITIDRFEGDFAVLELPDGKFINVPKVLFCDAKEGDRFEIQRLNEDTDKETLFNKLFK